MRAVVFDRYQTESGPFIKPSRTFTLREEFDEFKSASLGVGEAVREEPVADSSITKLGVNVHPAQSSARLVGSIETADSDEDTIVGDKKAFSRLVKAVLARLPVRNQSGDVPIALGLGKLSQRVDLFGQPINRR